VCRRNPFIETIITHLPGIEYHYHTSARYRVPLSYIWWIWITIITHLPGIEYHYHTSARYGLPKIIFDRKTTEKEGINNFLGDKEALNNFYRR